MLDSQVAIQRALLRALAIVGIISIGLIHLVELPDAWHPTPGLATLFAVLSVACLVGAAALIYGDQPWAWDVAAVTAVGPILGYVLTRSTQLPFDREDVHNWTEPLGLVSLAVEAMLLALYAWQRLSRPNDAEAARSQPPQTLSAGLR